VNLIKKWQVDHLSLPLNKTKIGKKTHRDLDNSHQQCNHVVN